MAESIAARLVGPRGPFELVDQEIDGVTRRVFRSPPHSLADVYRKAVNFGPKVLAVQGDVRLTYADAFGRAAALAGALKGERAVGQGDSVAVVMENSPRWMTAFMAVTMLGARAVLASPQHSSETLGAMLATADCKLALADAEQVDARPDWGLPLMGADADGGSPLTDLPEIDPERPALVAFTSGSTGTPKGVRHSHRSLLAGLRNMMLGAALSAAARPASGPPAKPAPPSTLVLSPFSHVGGYSQVLLALMIAGKVVLPEGKGGEDLAALVEQEQVRALMGASSSMVREIIRNQGRRDLSSLATFGIHGAAFNPRLVEEILAAFPGASVGAGYGMTETGGSIAVASLTGPDARPGEAGRVLPSVDLRIEGPDGKPLAPDEVGRIRVRGAMVTQGYCGLPAQTQSVLRDGWLDTGDQGRLDADGRLYVLDRQSDVLVHGAREFSSSALERLALGHPAVDEAAALASPGGAGLVILATTRVGEAPDPETLRASILAAHAMAAPLDVRFVDAFPRTASGKIDKPALARGLAADA